ncbi:MAG: HAD-IC family P-type ATPase, partial [Clostridia bacterium]|nr:HAD-IC family P-type ATPase [Clostridia bacterium]
ETNTKYSKSILSIILTNSCTFFNLLGLIVFIAYLLVQATFANFLFIFFFAINLTIGIFQEIRAKLSIEKLSILQNPITKVIRNGVEMDINSKEIVLDDIFKITSGNQIPVDGIVKSGYVEVNESLLTGESIAVKKNVGDFLLAGSFVTGGSCIAKAEKVAEECYVQKLTIRAKKFKKPHSKLMGTIQWIVKIIGILIVPIAIGIGLVNYKSVMSAIDGGNFIGTSLQNEVVTKTGAVIIGMIPSGLVLLTTMALSLGVIRLHKSNTLVQDMYSLEMLARVDVLCLDKTGTITDGRMNVLETTLLTQNHPYSVNDIIGSMEKVLDDNNQTAVALRAHFIPEKEFTAIKTIPFSSQRKYSAITFEGVGTYALGAPEFILSDIPDYLKSQIDKYTYTGNRVLLLAYSPASISSKNTLPQMKPIAIIAISDNIREEAINTIKWFKDNDVDVKVISGDNPITVSEIAKRAGISNSSNWISLEGLSDKEVASIADKYTVFGRVSPDQKAVLIKSLKRAGHTVAMTGDGVNDILAMRESDCSITVATGADAAKNVAHIVLTDNNFNSMPKVVAEGRRVINNIQQSASLYLMKTIFITLLALLSIASTTQFPFASGMLTILEFAVIGVPSIILSLQPNEKRVEGDFLYTIFSNAIPGALILLLNVYIIKLLNLLGIFNDTLKPELLCTTLQVVSFTLGGAVYLFKICKPFNLGRALLMVAVSLIIAVWMIFLLDTSIFIEGLNFFMLTNMFPVFGASGVDWKYFVLLIAIFELDIPLVDKFFEVNKNLTSNIKNKDK